MYEGSITFSPEAISSKHTPLSHCIFGRSPPRTSGEDCSRSAPKSSRMVTPQAPATPLSEPPGAPRRRRLLQVRPEKRAHGNPVGPGRAPERGHRSPRPAALERRDKAYGEARRLGNLLEGLVRLDPQPPQPLARRPRAAPAPAPAP